MKIRPNYTKGTAQSMVAIVECVYSLGDTCEMEDVIEQLRQYGAARVVEEFTIVENFDEACKILDKRAQVNAEREGKS